MRDESSGWITLHPGEFYLLWRTLELGDPPVVLDVPRAGATESHRAELVGLAGESLAGRGLGTMTAPDRDLVDLLRTLANPDVSVDLSASGADVSFRSYGAIGERGAVTVGTSGEDVLVGPVRPDQLIPTMLEALPDVEAAPGAPANVGFAEYRRACRAGEAEGASGFLDALREAGVRSSQAAMFLRAVEGRRAGGYVGATSRTRGRTQGTVNWVDTEHGRYALRKLGDWVTVTPADVARLRGMAEEMVDDLT
ncbi:ESX secretion-associated protein EspG [Prauserella halophila]|uniref:ESX secretion-associated protein EspG n=1 Tax=Prauserella halophila TaxID=185641 RepID=A0ABN1WMX5_9PSEU|nr:ESX secretion-associated protein EspG [Prauserella halophila]MCP2237730.1 EspG family protein [Prauserella halophila]